jgi:hypothetical protein
MSPILFELTAPEGVALGKSGSARGIEPRYTVSHGRACS